MAILPGAMVLEEGCGKKIGVGRLLKRGGKRKGEGEKGGDWGFVCYFKGVLLTILQGTRGQGSKHKAEKKGHSGKMVGQRCDLTRVATFIFTHRQDTLGEAWVLWRR